MAFWDWIAQNESGPGSYYAKNPQSSASGKYQMTKGFFEGLRNKYRPGAGTTFDQFQQSPQIQEEYKNLGDQDNEKTARNAGLPYDDRNKGIFWRLGAPDAMKVMSANPTTPVHLLLSPDILKVNPDLVGKTAGDLVDSNGYPNARPNKGPDMVDPTKLTPMSMAMNGGIPNTDEQFQMAANPMQKAMQPEPVDLNMETAVGMQGAGAKPTPEAGWFQRNFGKDSGYDLGGSMIGAGAALSSITNPQGGAVLSSLLNDRRGAKNRYSTQQLWDGTVLKVDKETGDTSVVRGGDDDLASKKKGIPTEADARATLQGSEALVNDMVGKLETLANDPDLKYISGGWNQVPTGFGEEFSISGGKAAKLSGIRDSLLAQMTIDEVRRLKESSATLGQISNYEDQLFQKAALPINPNMAEKDLRDAFREKAKVFRELQQIRQQKYQRHYGQPVPETPGVTTPPPGQTGGADDPLGMF